MQRLLEGSDDGEEEEKQEDNADTEVERINIAHLLAGGDDSEVDDSKSDDEDESDSNEEETAKPDYADEAADLAAHGEEASEDASLLQTGDVDDESEVSDEEAMDEEGATMEEESSDELVGGEQVDVAGTA